MSLEVVAPKHPQWSDSVSSIIRAIDGETLGILTGAGISREAGLPLAGELMDPMLRALAQAVDCDETVFMGPRSKIRLEPFLRVFQSISGNAPIEGFLEIFRWNHYGLSHVCLASMLCRSSPSSLVTLNFDYLIEEAALEMFGDAPAVLVGDDSDRTLEEPVKHSSLESRGSLIKPHGTLIRGGGQRGIVATLQQVGVSLPHSKAHLIRGALDRGALLVAGYSDDDIDVFPVVASLKSVRAVYWLAPSVPSDRVCRWLAERRGVVLLATSETLFKELLAVGSHLRIEIPKSEVETPATKCTEHCVDWLGRLSRLSPAAPALAAAWLAHDLGHRQEAERLYQKAASLVAGVREKEFVDYRYAEFLRTGHRYHEAFQRYASLRHAARASKQYLMLGVLHRATAATHRSASHRSPRSLSRLTHWVSAWIDLFGAARFLRRGRRMLAGDSRFADESGIWMHWEAGMLWLGAGLQDWIPAIFSRMLLRLAIRCFQTSARSNDIFEQATAMFSTARALYALQCLGSAVSPNKIAILMNEASWRFEVLQDATGINNITRLRDAIADGRRDPWYHD